MLVLVDIPFLKEHAISTLNALPTPITLHRLLLSILQAVSVLLIICFWVYRFALNVILHARLALELPAANALHAH